MLIYDIEIVKGILGEDETAKEDIEYCEGWNDHKNMGISCVCAYDYQKDQYRAFCADNLDEFASLVNSRPLAIGFNNLRFDNSVLRAFNIDIPDDKVYDVLVEVWLGKGLGPTFKFPTHVGYGLDACVKANFGGAKTGHGAMAPIDWQRGNIGTVIDYCLNDVYLTKKLVDRIIRMGGIVCPREDKWINMRGLRPTIRR